MQARAKPPEQEGSSATCPPAQRADARRNRARLLGAAEVVFAEQGIAVPVDEVARRAGVGVGTLYRHFPTKEALFEAVVLDRLGRMADEAERLAGSPDPAAAFFELVEHVGMEVSRKRDLAEALANAGVDLKTVAAEPSERLKRSVGELLRRAQAAGAVRADVDPEDVFGLVVGVCMASEPQSQGTGTRREDSLASRRRMLAVVCAGLRPGG